MEKTLSIVKPDGVKRGLIGEILKRYEKKNLQIINLKMVVADKEILEKHYEEHKEKSFFNDLMKYMCSGEIVLIEIQGEDAVEVVRKINGETNPLKAEMGTIRGDFSNSVTENIVHGSDSVENAKQEIALWFK